MNIILKFLGTIVGLVVLLLIREQINEFRYRRACRKAGTALPLTLLDFPFGFPSVLKLRNALQNNRVFSWADGYVHGNMRKYIESGVLDGNSPHLYTVRHQNTFDMNILTIDPENIKTILATNFKDYALGDRYFQLLPLLGNGIFTLSGEGWKHSRAMLRPQFTREQVSQLDSLREHISVLTDIFKQKSHNGKTFLDAQKHFHELTMDTATEFLFGESVDSLRDSKRLVQGPTRLVSASEFAESFNYCLGILTLRTHFGPLYWLMDGFEFRRRVSICKNFVDYFVYRSLEKRKKTLAGEKIEDGDDRYVFIDELAKETSDPLVIRDQCFNILLAGRDTTASLLSFVTFYLARDKRVWNKLRAEILEHFDHSTDNISFETLKRCTYLGYVINEVLRLHPIVPLNFRSAVRDTILPRGGGRDQSQPFLIQKGTKVVYSVYLLHRDKRLWGETANDFNPERWSDNSLHTWDYLPFNGGPRICIGQQFALTEAGFAIVRICQLFKDIVFEGSAEYHGMEEWTKLTQSVANGVKVSFVDA